MTIESTNADHTRSSYRWAVRLALGIAACVVVLGAFTRLVDAGLGCPDWPGCYGHVLWPTAADEIARAEAAFPDAPVDLSKTWPEMVHRYFASGLGLVILLMTAAAWRGGRAADRQAVACGALPRGLLTALLLMVILQGAFGAWTVTLKLWPQVVTAHLLGGFTTLSLLWLLALRMRATGPLQPPTLPRVLLPHALLALVLVVAQIALGGWVSSNYAALACPDFPTCHGQWWPAEMDARSGFNLAQSVGPNYLGGQLESDARVAIQVTHRLGAVCVLLVLGTLIARLWAHSRGLALAIGAALTVQIALGIANVVALLPLWVATAHNAVGALTLLTVVTVNYAAFPIRDPVKLGPQPAATPS